MSHGILLFPLQYCHKLVTLFWAKANNLATLMRVAAPYYKYYKAVGPSNLCQNEAFHIYQRQWSGMKSQIK